VQCWGCSKNGSCRWWPKRIELTRPAAQLAVALDGACARLDNGSVQCWGDYAPTTPNRGTPDPKAAEVTGLRDVVQLTAAGSERCALDRQGQVSCWTLARPTPTRVAGLERVAAIAAGRSFTCAIVEPQRDVRCWGLPETAGVVRIPQLDHVRQIALGHSFGVALTDAGAVYHWGPYQYGEGATKQAAANATQFPLEPVRAASHLKVRKLVVTGSTTCFELESGELTCERIMSKLPFHIREVLPAVTFDMGPPR
jgi:alpha-tubulin suppressor-like RCC1 family protein